jgi:hypothetical protein
LPVGELKVEYEYLVRGFLRLAAQFEQDRKPKRHASAVALSLSRQPDQSPWWKCVTPERTKKIDPAKPPGQLCSEREVGKFCL